MRLYTQLNFGGNCEEAFRFYEKHVGGKITFMMRRAEVPDLKMRHRVRTTQSFTRA